MTSHMIHSERDRTFPDGSDGELCRGDTGDGVTDVFESIILCIET
jgi:hypothetical protein